MNMLKILKFDPQAFFRTVDKSAGDVLLHLADGSQHDLKLNSPIRLLLQSMTPGREGLIEWTYHHAVQSHGYPCLYVLPGWRVTRSKHLLVLCIRRFFLAVLTSRT